MYSEKVMEHFRNPQNMGSLEDYDAVGKVGNPVCGDIMYIYIKVKDDVITDIGFKTMGCAAAIATSSMITELAKGQTLDDALNIGRDNVAEALDGLPPIKMHCSNLSAEGLHKAIENYRKGTPDGESKNDVLKQFTDIPGISQETASLLYESGFTSLDELKRTSIDEFKGVKGIGEQTITTIKEYFPGHDH